jgi:hypothetical protein
MDSTALVGGLGSMLVLLVGIFLIYFVLLFIGGIMLYFFTGKDERPGKQLLGVISRVATRFYAHLWMFIMSIAGLVGFSMFIKSILGALFEDFVYKSTRFGTSIDAMQKSDLQNGLILFILAVIIYLVHWAFAYMIETEEEKKGTIMSKLINNAGLFTTSFVFFGTLIVFVFDLIAGTQAGGSLAWVMGSFPFWMLYVLKSVWVIRSEK